MPVILQLRSLVFFFLVLLIFSSVCYAMKLSGREKEVEKQGNGLEREKRENSEKITNEEDGQEKGKHWNNRPIIGILAQEVDMELLEVLRHLGISKSSLVDLNRNHYRPGTDRADRGDNDGWTSNRTLHSHLLNRVQLSNNRLSQRGNDIYSIIPYTTEPVAEPLQKIFGNSVDQFLKSRRTEYQQWESDFEGEPGTTSNKNLSYIAASYVKFVESGGARVVPIMIDRDDEYYEKMFHSLNGVLFPGGAVAVDETSGYGRAGKLIYEKARASSLAGDPFPLWGTCLGFELMMFLAARSKELRARCQGQNIASTTKGTRAIHHSRLWRQMSHHLRRAMETEPLAANFHHFCVTPENFTAFNVNTDFNLLATSLDAEGLEYVAMAEGTQGLPFFAVQFHPEKNIFEWTTLENHNAIPHSANAAAVASYFARFFVDQARRSQHSFSSPEEEQSALVYNFNPVDMPNTSMEQVYFFPLD
ncbi:gamma-glutamyl hydrolase-like isoform X2 [Oratosquilla oratoria]|uniref:gamma-glutamyl hydrolase-like isoform X2 n=1 Tax=Oratosquilla oratoria TaxID=337810 RepID=UPI003F75FAAA